MDAAHAKNEPAILRTDAGRVATLTLNMPDQRTPLSNVVMEEMIGHLEAIDADEAIGCVVLASTGSVFCSGHNLKEINANSDNPEFLHDLFTRCKRMMTTIQQMGVPVIAKVDGIATAAGCQLVAACDLAIATEGSRFCVPGTNMGGFCHTPMVTVGRNMHVKSAMMMALTGDLFDTDAAIGFGLINEAVPAEQLDGRVDELAEKIASKSRGGTALGKRAFHRQMRMELDEAFDYATEVMVRHFATADSKEGIAAFFEKRPPQYRAAKDA